MKFYKSDFPNQVHQLNVSISQHYHLLSNDVIKWQEKKFDINWINHEKTSKKHLVNFIIRDHFSSCFYAEIHPIDRMPKIEEFLFNAWNRKTDYAFHGAGHYIITPQKTQEQFPSLINFFNNVENVKLQTPASGFSSAVRSILDWERGIRSISHFLKNTDTRAGFQQNINHINRLLNNGYDIREDSNLKKWQSNKPIIISLPDNNTFCSMFKSEA